MCFLSPFYGVVVVELTTAETTRKYILKKWEPPLFVF